jgi:tRNA (guanine-N(7)-)-methyltransferase
MGDYFHFDPSAVAVTGDELLLDELGLSEGAALHVEIGFGKDIRILREAERDPDGTYLGVEISRKKAASFCRKVARKGLRNVRAYQGDARHLLREMLPADSVSSFTILFPDPWPKRRHWKHRWIQADTAALLARAMRPGALLIAATDHDDYAVQIEAELEGAGLEMGERTREIPEEDRSLFAQRFERLGETVTYMRFRKP